MGANNEELLNTIRYYQESLDKYSSNGNNSKLVGVIKKLKKLPIATSHLEATGIGRTVNGLRKLGGEVGDAAKSLVTRWKEMVVQEDVKKEETGKASPDANLHKNETVSNRHDEKENNYTDTKHKEREKSSSHRSGDDVRNSEKERNKLDKHSSNNKNTSLDKKDNRKQKYDRDNSSERHSSKTRDLSDSSSDSEGESYKSKSHSKTYRSESDEDDSSSDDEKSSDNHKKSGSKSSNSRSYEKKDGEDVSNKKHKYDNNNTTERHSSKRKHHTSTSESEEDYSDRKNNKSHSKSRKNESDDEETRKTSDRHKKDIEKNNSNHKSSSNKKEHRDKEKSSKKYKSEHESSSKSNSSKRRHHSSSSSESEEENYEKKHTKHLSDSEDDEEDRRHKSKKESEDKRKKHKSKSSKSDRHEQSSSKSKSKEKTDNNSSSKSKTSSRSEISSNNEKHKKSSHDSDVERQEKSRSKHEKESEALKESKSHSSKHEKKDKKEESRTKDKYSKDDKDTKKEKTSTSSTKNKESSKSSSSKNKSTSEKNKAKYEPVDTTKIVHGIDSESGASFAEALGMCGPMVFSKGASTSKKKSTSLPSPEKQNKIMPSSTSSRMEKPEPLDEKYVPSLLKEVPAPAEPLPINISSLLPEISPNYKPVAFPLDAQHKRILTPDEALSQAISNKNMRTKVYSGNKTKGGDVESLFNICVKILQDNLDAIECTGGVPYMVLKPILEKATPDQLFNLEHYNPYLIEDTDELWRLHCLKEFRTKKREEMETWREMYMRCLDEREVKLNAITANIKESQDKSLPVRTTKLAYVDSIAKPPRNIAKKQAKNGIVNRIPVKVTPSSRLSALATAGEASKVSVPNPGSRAVNRSSSGSSASAIKPKKAPLMAKTLSLLKNRFKR